METNILRVIVHTTEYFSPLSHHRHFSPPSLLTNPPFSPPTLPPPLPLQYPLQPPHPPPIHHPAPHDKIPTLDAVVTPMSKFGRPLPHCPCRSYPSAIYSRANVLAPTDINITSIQQSRTKLHAYTLHYIP